MKNYYLVDFENVSEHGLRILEQTVKSSVCYIFYTDTCNPKLSLDCLINLKHLKIKFIKIPAGNQSLDMHLVSFLGKLLQKHGKKEQYRIVSNDSDFDNIVLFWKGRGYQNLTRLAVSMCNKKTHTEKENSLPITLAKDTPNDPWMLKLSPILHENNVPEEVAKYMYNQIVQYASVKNGKATIYRNIVKKFGQNEGLIYYSLVKKIISG